MNKDTNLRDLLIRIAPGLAHSAGDRAWLRTPVGMVTRAGSGPSGKTCASCAHFDLGATRWSDCGRAAPCLETRRLRLRQRCPEVPASTPACSRYVPGANPVAALADADYCLAERAAEKRAEIKRHQTIIRRLNEEIHEIDQEREKA